MATMLEELRSQSCTPMKGAEHGLSVGEVGELVEALPGWALSDDGKTISKDFGFRNFHRTMAFVNALAWIAHREDHHPDMEVGYGHCLVRYTTHDVGGLSRNDFICAAKVEALQAP
ncbi:MAG TPA: 4a-hydroxytetrahydrobiopterin dehydratase [Candidatus Saccharimonadia bacterium]|nr:4a-hydroxytetrahydrobiopterin dehydratase [Candidatus Saccharimonadia bacterium]